MNTSFQNTLFPRRSQLLTGALLAGLAGVLSPHALATSPTMQSPFNVTVDDQFDWLLLTSNELLKGEIKNLYDDKLEFESDNLDTQYFDWEDVKALRSAGEVSVGFLDLSTKTGKLEIVEGKAYLDGAPFDRTQILTIIPGTQREANYWSGKVTLGANIRSGNTDQLDYTASANAIRRTTESRFNTDYLGKFAKNDGENIANNHRINSSFDWFISRQFYVRPVFLEYYKDPFLNIDSKITLGAGLGYDIIDNSRTLWTIGGGPGYTYTRFNEVKAGESDSEGTAAFVVDTRFEHELTDYMDLNARYQLLYGSEDAGGYSHHALTGLSIELTDSFDLDLSLVWDHTNNPRENADGTFPKSNDFQFIIGLGIDF